MQAMRCKLCKQYLQPVTSFATADNSTGEVKCSITCQSKNVVYFLSYSGCNNWMSYIGQTKNLRNRINNHISESRTGFKLANFQNTFTSWAVGDYCISLKVLKSPHKEMCSFKLTILWLSLSSSFASAKYFDLSSMHTTTVAMWAPAPCCIDSTHAHLVLGRTIPNPFSFSRLGTSQNNQNLISRHSVESKQYGAGAHKATVVVCILYWWIYLAEDNEEERDNHSIVSLNECISL